MAKAYQTRVHGRALAVELHGLGVVLDLKKQSLFFWLGQFAIEALLDF